MAQLKVMLSPVKHMSGLFQQNVIKNGTMSIMQQMNYSDDRPSNTPSNGAPCSMSASDDTYKSRVVEFSQNRTRDLMGRAIDIQQENQAQEHPGSNETVNNMEGSDSHVESYDTHGNLSLHSAMQSMVPEPFTIHGKAPTHLNMPGGHLSQGQKYLSDDLQNTHYKQNSREFSTRAGHGQGMSPFQHFGFPFNKQLHGHNVALGVVNKPLSNHCPVTFHSTYRLLVPWNFNGSHDFLRSYSNESGEKLTQRAKLKQAVKDYGATVIVFHVSISLVSLGAFYLAVSSGLDVTSLLAKLPIDSSFLEGKLATGVSTFALAYAVHKVFAPVRIGITLTSTPFIVHYLRKVGFIKPPRT